MNITLTIDNDKLIRCAAALKFEGTNAEQIEQLKNMIYKRRTENKI